MARPTPPTHDVLDDLNSYADHLREWVARNPVPIIATGILVLCIAGAIGGYRWWETERQDGAAAAVAKLSEEYRAAMGAQPGSAEIAEPANPETARTTRMDFATRLMAAADEHSGAASARIARLQAADLFARAGADDRANDAIAASLEGVSANDPLRGLLLRRSAAAHESAGHWAEAAAAYLAAGEIEGFPLQLWSKADAARCFAEAGDRSRAADLSRAIESDPAAAAALPPHLTEILEGLRSGAAAAATP